MNTNYLEDVKADVRELLDNEREWYGVNSADFQNSCYTEYESWLNDVLFCKDSITGNASGSYYCNKYKAQEMLGANLSIIGDMLYDGFIDKDSVASYFENDNFEALDVCARCFVLPQAISEVLAENADNKGV